MNKLRWKCLASGYYTATGFSGIELTLMHEPRIPIEHGMADPHALLKNKAWALYAGDNTARRAVRRTLREAKLTAEEIFG